MGIAQKSLFRALTNRKLMFEGKHRVHGDAIFLDDLQVKRVAGSDAEGLFINDGETVIVSTLTKLKSMGRLLFVKVNPELYMKGIVSCPTFIDPSDNMAPVSFRFEASEDVNLLDLSYVVKLFIAE